MNQKDLGIVATAILARMLATHPDSAAHLAKRNQAIDLIDPDALQRNAEIVRNQLGGFRSEILGAVESNPVLARHFQASCRTFGEPSDQTLALWASRVGRSLREGGNTARLRLRGLENDGLEHRGGSTPFHELSVKTVAAQLRDSVALLVPSNERDGFRSSGAVLAAELAESITLLHLTDRTFAARKQLGAELNKLTVLGREIETTASRLGAPTAAMRNDANAFESMAVDCKSFWDQMVPDIGVDAIAEYVGAVRSVDLALPPQRPALQL